MNFDCDPARVDKLKSIIYREIDKIEAEGPTAVDLDKTVMNLLKDREEAKAHNSFWMNTLYSVYDTGINNADPENFENIIKSITVKDVQDFTQNFKKGINIMDIVFMPKVQ